MTSVVEAHGRRLGQGARIADPSRDGAGPTITVGVGSAHEETVGVGAPCRPGGGTGCSSR
ncbi:hypothetical protein [Streptomyces sp. ME18-1-4]|uniref:hypothetical protein n=1 Tax=Streptomyces sp. ME18-1-4 TaxID=3028685 RepID=UPI0029AA82DE|nr:hypothetical protein [Streptomyces sp. ME18-1-4]MDX3248332.1 hypothetical protein [Streptomyces sp. ME18-1-4]